MRKKTCFFKAFFINFYRFSIPKSIVFWIKFRSILQSNIQNAKPQKMSSRLDGSTIFKVSSVGKNAMNKQKNRSKIMWFSQSSLSKIQQKSTKNKVLKSIPQKTPQISIFMAFWPPKTLPNPHQSREKIDENPI